MSGSSNKSRGLTEQRMICRDGKVVVRAYTHDGYDGFEKMVAWCRKHGYAGHQVWATFADEDGKYTNEPRHYGA